MSDIAIRVEGLGKEYRIGKRERYRTLRDTITDVTTAPFRKMRSLFGRSGKQEQAPSDLIWALQDVSFEVPRGSVVGVIGRNGAGKSTLLKVLSRITEPTEGRVEIHGRVGSLLEVGTGFHPELTGRENIFLNGAILGMRRTEIERKFDEIVAFAEVDKFIDTPVKHYSSGMYMRLAFAVAAHLEPEILIVDEVLAVGDAQFQKKCLGKMGDVAKAGRTVVFVSHNMVAVQNLCGLVVCLNAGKVEKMGIPAEIVRSYLAGGSTVASAEWKDPRTAPGNEAAKFRRIEICSGDEVTSSVSLEESVEIRFEYENFVKDATWNVSFVLETDTGITVLNSFSTPQTRPIGLLRDTCAIPGSLLNSGSYRLNVLLVRDGATVICHVPEVVSFEVVETQRRVEWYGTWVGVIRPDLAWRAETVEDVRNGIVVTC